MSKAPNEDTMMNQSDRGTPQATPPAMARSTNPVETQARSTTGSCFRRTEYAVVTAT